MIISLRPVATLQSIISEALSVVAIAAISKYKYLLKYRNLEIKGIEVFVRTKNVP